MIAEACSMMRLFNPYRWFRYVYLRKKEREKEIERRRGRGRRRVTPLY
jgi:hypothetical protein